MSAVRRYNTNEGGTRVGTIGDRSCVGLGIGMGLVGLVLVACTHEVERFDFGGPQGSSIGSIGSIGSATVDAESSSTADDGEDGTDSTGGDSPASGPADDEPAATTMPGSSTSPDTSPASDTTGSGDPVLDACLEIAANECESCACELCLDPLYACQQDAGCVAMRDCAEQSGCAGVDCLEPCGDVIDMYGGAFGSSGMLALELSDCLTASCPACF